MLLLLSVTVSTSQISYSLTLLFASGQIRDGRLEKTDERLHLPHLDAVVNPNRLRIKERELIILLDHPHHAAQLGNRLFARNLARLEIGNYGGEIISGAWNDDTPPFCFYEVVLPNTLRCIREGTFTG